MNAFLQKIISFSVGSFLLIATTTADTRAKQEAELAKYERYAGVPVEEFRLWKLHGFQLVGPEKVVVWTTINDAYLITVEQPCSGLEYAKGIVLSSTQHVVSKKFDHVSFGHERCQIAEMRPIDYRRLKAEAAQRTKMPEADH